MTTRPRFTVTQIIAALEDTLRVLEASAAAGREVEARVRSIEPLTIAPRREVLGRVVTGTAATWRTLP